MKKNFLTGRKKKKKNTHPTNNALLIRFRLISDAKILLISTDWAWHQIGAKTWQKHACNMCTYSNWASILHTTVGGWAGAQKIHFLSHSFWAGWHMMGIADWMGNEGFFFLGEFLRVVPGHPGSPRREGGCWPRLPDGKFVSPEKKNGHIWLLFSQSKWISAPFKVAKVWRPRFLHVMSGGDTWQPCPPTPLPPFLPPFPTPITKYEHAHFRHSGMGTGGGGGRRSLQGGRGRRRKVPLFFGREFCSTRSKEKEKRKEIHTRAKEEKEFWTWDVFAKKNLYIFLLWHREKKDFFPNSKCFFHAKRKKMETEAIPIQLSEEEEEEEIDEMASSTPPKKCFRKEGGSQFCFPPLQTLSPPPPPPPQQ